MLAEYEAQLVALTLERLGGNKLAAARSLGVSRNWLKSRLRKE
jgi:DNA-binding NtrC family response regulator